MGWQSEFVSIRQRGNGNRRIPVARVRAESAPASRDISIGGCQATINPRVEKITEAPTTAPTWAELVTQYSA
eukprot:7297941-Pyramimonas_sp.AAC.1